MNVNKKFDRFRQWGKEKMGGEIRTDKTDDFKSLENEMNLRHEGMEKLHNAMNTYVKSLSKKTEGDSKDKNTAIANLGSAMTKHGEDFQDGSNFGECLVVFGQTHERIARMQDTYAANATSSWLDACERSMAQMKEYQNARKKLETRRLAYDTSMSKVQKSKKDDYRSEDEVRTQKAKYEESQEDVSRRMQDIIDAEGDNMQDMYSFLEAEIAYHDRARDALLQLKQNWPVAVEGSPSQRRQPRFASAALSRIPTSSTVDEDDFTAPNPSFRNTSRNTSASSSPHRQPHLSSAYEESSSVRHAFQRAVTTEAVTRHVSRTPSEPPAAAVQRLRPTQRVATATAGAYSGGSSPEEVSPDRYFYDGERSSSPATSQGTDLSRTTSWSNFSGTNVANGGIISTPLAKKAPPPPPPSRSTKPPPPPPPMKRSALSSSSVPSAY